MYLYSIFILYIQIIIFHFKKFSLERDRWMDGWMDGWMDRWIDI